jgi:hypothetical protein
MYGRSSLLLLILTGYKDAEGYMPGKLFEYLATGLPIFGTGPEQGDANNLLKRTGAGEMIDGSDTVRIKQQLASRFLEWTSATGGTPLRPAETSYTRKELTRQLTELL